MPATVGAVSMSESCRLWRNFSSFASAGTGLGWLLQALHGLAAPGRSRVRRGPWKWRSLAVYASTARSPQPHPRGSPSPRVAMIPRWISLVPPAIVSLAAIR